MSVEFVLWTDFTVVRTGKYDGLWCISLCVEVSTCIFVLYSVFLIPCSNDDYHVFKCCVLLCGLKYDHCCLDSGYFYCRVDLWHVQITACGSFSLWLQTCSELHMRVVSCLPSGDTGKWVPVLAVWIIPGKVELDFGNLRWVCVGHLRFDFGYPNLPKSSLMWF
jgi:hypothetical protein